MEHDDLWQMTQIDQAWDAQVNRHLATTHLQVYSCPGIPILAKPMEPALTGYIGIAGVGADAANLPRDDRRAGFFGYDRIVRREDIKDGASKTMMVMESTTELGPWAAGGSSTVRPLDPEDRPYLALEGPFGVNHIDDILCRSPHVTSNIGFADGSVRGGVLASVSSETLEALATIAGGDTPGDDF
jgi:prepilin-type processing-associated H-X9-DG protein